MLWFNCAVGVPTKGNAELRNLFLQVDKDLKQGKLNSYRKHQTALSSYVLFPYLKYQVLIKNISNIRPSEIEAFRANYPDFYLTPNLYRTWLRDLAHKKKWREYIKSYEHADDIEMQCHFIHAYLIEKNDEEVLKYVAPLWLNGNSQPGACNPVFERWRDSGKLTRNMLWKRIKLSINEKNYPLARFLAKELPKSEQKLVELWIRADNEPEVIHKSHYFNVEHSAISEIIVHSLLNIAKQDPENALQSWQKLSKQHQFNDRHYAEVIREVGVSLGKQQHKLADKWLNKIPKNYQNNLVYETRLRHLLYNNKWKSINSLCKSLPADLKQKDSWLYWMARSEHNLGNKKQAIEIYKKLAASNNYYGFLASTRISNPIKINNKKYAIAADKLAHIAKQPAVQRALELSKIQRNAKALKEWEHATKNLSVAQLHAYSSFAIEHGMPGWAIATLSESGNNHDYSLRFPKAYAKNILQESHKNRLEPSLVFAITRQESNFIPNSKSSAGALGLMQIMPNTAKMVAKKANINIKSKNDILKIDNNIKLGTKYYRMMLEKYDQNPVLAAASYNAGPSRVAKWLPKVDTATDVWIETIPFRETRNYVKNVLAYTIIYEDLMDNTPSLKRFMPIIIGTKDKYIN